MDWPHIHASFNNTIIMITDKQGNALHWATAGGFWFLEAQEKSTPFAAQVAAETSKHGSSRKWYGERGCYG
ncbi:MAG: hypothetical protein Ct9H90mP27_0660 [Gammaproteobacteria bacterium]|nr:MAG: hypothetical protein Ct9H90mP27_0660 [Gammaproteobacteria bacterium]